MANFFLAPAPLQNTFFIPGGNTPGNGAQLFTYAAGTSTKQTVYKDNQGSAAWTNPIVLDSGGNLPNGGVIWFPASTPIKAIYAPSNDTDPPVSPYRTIDNLIGINDTSVSQSEWVAGPAPTFVGANSFIMNGDQSATFVKSRKLKFLVTAGTVYGSIDGVSVATGSTTVNVAFNAGALDSGLNTVSYSLLAPDNPSINLDYSSRLASSIPSSANGTTNIWASDGSYAHITGTNGIANFSTAPYSGLLKNITFDGVLTLTSSGALGLPSATLQTAAGDFAQVYSENSTTNRLVNFVRASGSPVNFPFVAMRSYLTGLAMSVASTNASNVISTAAGFCVDSTNSTTMALSSAIWKNNTSTWTVGLGTGGLDTGTISTNCWYHHYVITRSDTGVVDSIFSTSVAGPVMPANYTAFRRYGSTFTNSSSKWQAFQQDGDFFQWIAPGFLDINVANPGGTASTSVMHTPLGVTTFAWLYALINNPATDNIIMYLSDPNLPDVAPGVSTATLEAGPGIGVSQPFYTTECNVRTDALSRIRSRCSASAVGDIIRVVTKGWRDTRGRDS